MSKKHKETIPNVVQMPKRTAAAAKRESEKKWGVEVIAQGFNILPSLLFRAQKRLGLSPSQLALIVQLTDFWWREDDIPWPKKETIAQRLGITEKQVQRIVRDLEKRGYIRRVKRLTRHGQTSNGYDLSGLAMKLQQLAPEFAEAAEAKRKVEPRGGLKNSIA